MLDFYRSYDHNLNAENIAGLTGTGNTIVPDSRRKRQTECLQSLAARLRPVRTVTI